MRQVTICLRPIQEHRGLGAEERGVMGFSKLSIFDQRLLGTIAVVLITVMTLSNPEPATKTRWVKDCPRRGRHQVMSFVLSPTSSQIATTNSAGRVTLRSAETGWQIERFLDYPGYARAVAFSPDGRSLAAGGIEPGVCLWDLSSPKCEPTRTIVIPIQRARLHLFSPDSQSLAITTDLDGTILLWDLAKQRERMVLHHPSPVTSIAFSPDGRRLATGGTKNDCSILLWDLETGSRQVLLEDGHGPTMAIAFSPDGVLLASASLYEHHARLWDLKTHRVRRVFAGHARSLNSVAFSPEGSLLATAGNDGTVGLWTVATGQREASLDGQATCLRTVAFSPDGRTLFLSSGNDDDLRLWEVAELLGASPGPAEEQSSRAIVVIASE